MTHLIRQIGTLSFATPDLDASISDMVDIVGMKLVERTDTTAFLTCNRRRAEIVFVQAAEAAVLSVGLEAVTRDAIDEVLARALAEHYQVLHERPSVPGTERSVTIISPDGLAFEIHTPVPRDQPSRYLRRGARPRRLEHVNVQVPDAKGVGEAMSRIFGMKLSERAGYEFIFYRSQDGYHHTVALNNEPADLVIQNDVHARLLHYAFDFSSFEDLATMGDGLVAKGRTLFWGPGRHGLGESIFTYWIDTNGAVVETSLEMRRIEDDDTHVPKVWEVSKELNDPWIYQWGGPPPLNFREPGLWFADHRKTGAGLNHLAEPTQKLRRESLVS